MIVHSPKRSPGLPRRGLIAGGRRRPPPAGRANRGRVFTFHRKAAARARLQIKGACATNRRLIPICARSLGARALFPGIIEKAIYRLARSACPDTLTDNLMGARGFSLAHPGAAASCKFIARVSPTSRAGLIYLPARGFLLGPPIGVPRGPYRPRGRPLPASISRACNLSPRGEPPPGANALPLFNDTAHLSLLLARSKVAVWSALATFPAESRENCTVRGP